MIVTATLTPAFDMTWTAPRLRIGHSHRTPTAVSRAGGKGANVARVLAAQAADVLAIARIGGATGEAVTRDLVDSRIPHRLPPITASTRRTVTIVDDTGAATTFNEAGEPLSAQQWKSVRRYLEAEPTVVDSRSYVRTGREAVAQGARRLMRVFDLQSREVVGVGGRSE